MNRLSSETSPYLRQHADNPVDWHPWGEEAFALARQRDVPIFLSVGYSACHWCHVMAHESFENETTALLMNQHFVNVKVDREERPDIDAIYMQATQAMTGRGGWPMSVWMFPDGRPFYTGTYFPDADRHGTPSFGRVCTAIDEAWRERRNELGDAAVQLTAAIGSGLPEVPEAAIDPAAFAAARAQLAEDFDPEWGGFGRAPKFPPAATLCSLCRAYARTPDDAVLLMITTTLDAMAAGGMYDQLGGGFARYSVDAHWLVPHFEKMLYDNALLTRAYTHGWLVTEDPRYQRIVEETIGYVLRDLRHADGGFFSAEDADSEGVEGKFYLWSRDEIAEVCGEDAARTISYFGATERGNFVDPHTNFSGNILHLASRTAVPDAAILRSRERLLARRVGRVRPGLDDKVLLAWNALMSRALAEAAWVFERDDWLDAARANVRFCLTHLRRDDGRFLRSWQADAAQRAGWGADGKARHLAYGEDYGALLEALLTLAEYDDVAWLAEAVTVADALIDLFADDEQGGFFTAGRDAEPLIVRSKDQMDNATPSENSLAANGLLRLAALTGHDRYAQIAERAIVGVAPFLGRHPTGFAYAMEAAERIVGPNSEIAIIGPHDNPATRALQRTVAGRLLPNSVLLSAAEATNVSPLLDGKTTAAGAPTAFVCEGYTCARPVTTSTELAALLDAIYG